MVSYDANTGERANLRPGTNGLVCVSLDPATDYTRCFHEERLAEHELRMKLVAEGKSDDEIAAAIVAAVESGSIPPRRFGSISYRYAEGNDGLKLLWVIRLPGLSGDQTGMPTDPDREGLQSGKGTPWLMRAGTSNAHLMIPINGTELSNFY